MSSGKTIDVATVQDKAHEVSGSGRRSWPARMYSTLVDQSRTGISNASLARSGDASYHSFLLSYRASHATQHVDEVDLSGDALFEAKWEQLRSVQARQKKDATDFTGGSGINTPCLHRVIAQFIQLGWASGVLQRYA